jgi:hypothetical protein
MDFEILLYFLMFAFERRSVSDTTSTSVRMKLVSKK